jgi:hypothetical protein
MNTSLAIQKAVEGGYAPNLMTHGLQPEDLLDPDFWQALGKTEGWEETKVSFRTKALDTSRVSKKGVVQVHIPAHNVNRIKKTPNKWKKVQHRLIDAIQQGRSIDEFFGEILKK